MFFVHFKLYFETYFYEMGYVISISRLHQIVHTKYTNRITQKGANWESLCFLSPRNGIIAQLQICTCVCVCVCFVHIYDVIIYMHYAWALCQPYIARFVLLYFPSKCKFAILWSCQCIYNVGCVHSCNEYRFSWYIWNVMRALNLYRAAPDIGWFHTILCLQRGNNAEQKHI